jgi:hypothetical protein
VRVPQTPLWHAWAAHEAITLDLLQQISAITLFLAPLFEPFWFIRNFISRFGPQKYQILVVLCSIVVDGVYFVTIQLPLCLLSSLISWPGVKLK